MKKNAKHLLNPNVFKQLLFDGSTGKLLKAIRAGQNVEETYMDAGRLHRIAPLSHVYRWDWARYPERCLELLRALLDAGADPNYLDEHARRPLHQMTDRAWRIIPKEAIRMLIEGGADPSLTAQPAVNRKKCSAIEAFIAEKSWDNLFVILESSPSSPGRCEYPPILALALNFESIRATRTPKDTVRQLVHALITGGDSVDKQDEHGRSARSRSPPEFLRIIEDVMGEIAATKAQEDLDAKTPAASARRHSSRL